MCERYYSIVSGRYKGSIAETKFIEGSDRLSHCRKPRSSSQLHEKKRELKYMRCRANVCADDVAMTMHANVNIREKMKVRYNTEVQMAQ